MKNSGASRTERSRRIAGRGTPEAVWLRWPTLQQAPRFAVEHYVPSGTRLVVVAPHPDDEILACGGLAATHAYEGGEILFIAVTDGEASHPDSILWSPRELARVRRAESLAGLDILQVAHRQIVRLGLPDGKVRQHLRRLVSGLHLLLNTRDVVVTTWRNDGHPDHDTIGHVVSLVCKEHRLPFLEAPVWMWHWAQPDDPRVPWVDIAGFEIPPAALALKRLALRAHTTQLTARDGRDQTPVLGSQIQKRASRSTEYFFTRGMCR